MTKTTTIDDGVIANGVTLADEVYPEDDGDEYPFEPTWASVSWNESFEDFISWWADMPADVVMAKIPEDEAGLPHEVYHAIPEPAPWKIVVQVPESKEKTDGGIFLPGESKDYQETLQYTGKLVAVGCGCWKHPKFGLLNSEGERALRPWARPGDTIQHARYTGTPTSIKHDGRVYKFKVMNDEDIISVLPDPERLKIYY